MYYCDTTLVVAVLTPESHSDVAEQWLRQWPPGELAISPWVDTEVASALASKQRQKNLTAVARSGAWLRWTTLVETGCMSVDVQIADYRRAGSLVDAGARGLRAGDALHLAIAERHRCAIATLDRDLADAALAIGLQVPTILAER